jgi:uncharacterized Zn finger protein (UPF0148 family)
MMRENKDKPFFTQVHCPTPGCPMLLRRSLLRAGELCCPVCGHREKEAPPSAHTEAEG